jgi:Rhodopirellula transposase DDE domain
MYDEAAIRSRFRAIQPSLNEKTRRLFAAAEAKQLGRGGVTAVARATGVSRRAIYAGLSEIRRKPMFHQDGRLRLRQPGAGRKRITDSDESILIDLDALVEPTAKGDPIVSLRWTNKSLKKLAIAMTARGHEVCPMTIHNLLNELGYTLQGNRKEEEGKQHPDRDKQFHYINKQVLACIESGSPAISVDTKKKEKIGNFKAVGKEWRETGNPVRTLTHDFMIPHLGKVNPYGIYDIAHNKGWISLGIDHDTSEFAVATIRRWWMRMGSKQYPKPKRILITADCGGSNGNRVRLWKVELQKLSTRLDLPIQVCHFPPGTSKWNRIEHRLFSFISQNWRGRPLITHAVMLNLIASTTTETGLKVRCELDPKPYAKGIKVPPDQFEMVKIEPASFHGEWNYTILP